MTVLRRSQRVKLRMPIIVRGVSASGPLAANAPKPAAKLRPMATTAGSQRRGAILSEASGMCGRPYGDSIGYRGRGLGPGDIKKVTAGRQDLSPSKDGGMRGTVLGRPGVDPSPAFRVFTASGSQGGMKGEKMRFNGVS